jgi:hypothetical protein
MNAEQLSAFLKAAKDVPLLQAGGLYATGATVSPYPVKEHHDLVTTKTIYTPLETILTARAAKSDAKDPATKALFNTYKKSATPECTGSQSRMGRLLRVYEGTGNRAP